MSHLCEITCWHSKYKLGINNLLRLQTKYVYILLSTETVWYQASDIKAVDKIPRSVGGFVI